MIITVANFKGGVSKTATAQAIGAWYRRQGNNVLYIDLDSQDNLTYTLQGTATGVLTALDVLTKKATAEESIQHTPNGDLIPGTFELVKLNNILTNVGREYRLREALEPIKGRYDYIVIDTPPQLGIATVDALTAAQWAVIPVQADIYSVQGIEMIADTIKTIQKYSNYDLKVAGILMTRYNKRAIISQDMRENLQKAAQALDTTVFDTAIRECVSVKEAQAMGQDIFAYAPKSNAAVDYESFIKEFEERTADNGR